MKLILNKNIIYFSNLLKIYNLKKQTFLNSKNV